MTIATRRVRSAICGIAKSPLPPDFLEISVTRDDDGDISVADSRVLAGRRQHRRRPGRVLRATAEDRNRAEYATLRLELPVRRGLHRRRWPRQYPGLPRGRSGQKASQPDQLLPAVAGGGRPARQSLRHAARRHTGLPG